jgi:hypothetical protein
MRVPVEKVQSDGKAEVILEGNDTRILSASVEQERNEIPEEISDVVHGERSSEKEASDSQAHDNGVTDNENAIQTKKKERVLFNEPKGCEDALIQLERHLSFLQEKGEHEYITITESADDNATTEQKHTPRVSYLLKKFLERLKTEALENRVEGQILGELKNSILASNWVSAQGKAASLLRKLRPFDIKETIRLIRATKKSEEVLQDQRTIVMLGKTGTGKSTTTHFLAGSEMVATKVDGQDHIAPQGMRDGLGKNAALEKVVASQRAVSETRYVTAVPIDLESFCEFEDGSVVLCDTPGFEDTAGPEVNIANGKGLIEAIKKCKNVRLLFLISYLGIDDRLQGIKKAAHTLVRIMNNVEEYLPAFSYAFTKVPENKKDQIFPMLREAYKRLKDEEKTDGAFMALLKDMLKKAKKKSIFVLDPVNDEPEEVWGKLMETTPIKYPEEAFKPFISASSKQVIIQQLQWHQQEVMSAIKRQDYDLIQAKLGELVELNVHLQHSKIETAYKNCVEDIKCYLTDSYRKAHNRLVECLEDKNGLDIQDINAYKIIVNRVKTAKERLSSHLTKKGIMLDGLEQDLVIKIMDIASNTTQWSEGRERLKRLDKMKLMADNFPQKEGIVNRYEKICSLLKEQFEQFLRKTQDAMKNLIDLGKSNCKNEQINMTLDALEEGLAAVAYANMALVEHTDKSWMEQHYQAVIQSCRVILEKRCEEVCKRFHRKEPLNEEDIGLLNVYMAKMDILENRMGLHQHLSKKDLVNIRETFTKEAMQYFKQCEEKLEACLTKENTQAFKDAKQSVDQMVLLRSITRLDRLTSEGYFRCISRVIGHVNELARDAEQILSFVLNGKKGANYKKLKQNLSILGRAAWLDSVEDFESGAYSDVVAKVHDDLIRHSQSLADQLREITLTIDDFSAFKQVFVLANQINEVYGLCADISAAKKYLENAIAGFGAEIGGVLTRVRGELNPNSKIEANLNKENERLKQLKFYRDEYNTSLPRKIFFEKKSFKNIKELQDKIKVKNAEREAEKEELGMQKKEKHVLLNATDKGVVLEEIEVIEQTGTQNTKEALTTESEKNKISQLTLAIEGKQKKVESVQKEIEELEKIEKDYKAIEEGAVSDRGKALLVDWGIESIDAIETDIKYIEITRGNKTEKSELRQAQEKKGLHIIESIGIERINKILNYLEAFGKNSQYFISAIKEGKIETKIKEAKTLHEVIQGAVQEYGGCVIKEMDACYARITSYKESSDNIKSGNALAQQTKNEPLQKNKINEDGRILANRLQEIINLKTEYPASLFLRFTKSKGKNIIKDWNKRLWGHNDDLTMEMHQLKSVQGLQTLSEKVLIAKAMSELDPLLQDKKDGRPYYKLYRTYSPIYESLAELRKEVLGAIRENNFFDIEDKLDTVKSMKSNVQAKTVYKKTQGFLLKALLGKMQKTQDECSDVFSDVKSDNTVEISRKLKGEIRDMRTIMSQLDTHIDDKTKNKLETQIKTAFGAMNKHIKKFLSGIEATVSLQNFEKMESRIMVADQVISILGEDCHEDIKKKFELEKTRAKESLDKLVEKYLEPENYFLSAPKDLYKRFKPVLENDVKYLQTWKEIEQKILKGYRTKLKQVQVTKQNIPEELEKLKKGLSYLPEELKNILEEDWNRANVDFQKKTENLKETVRDGGINEIKELADEYREQGSDLLSNRLCDALIRKIKGFSSTLDEKLKTNDFKEAEEQLKIIFKYKKTFAGMFSAIKKQVGKIEKELFSHLTTAGSPLHRNLKTMKDKTEIKNLEVMLKRFSVLIENLSLESLFLSESYETVKQVYKVLADYFSGMLEKYGKSFKVESMDASDLGTVLNDAQRHAEFVVSVKRHIIDMGYKTSGVSMQYTERRSKMMDEKKKIGTELEKIGKEIATNKAREEKIKNEVSLKQEPKKEGQSLERKRRELQENLDNVCSRIEIVDRFFTFRESIEKTQKVFGRPLISYTAMQKRVSKDVCSLQDEIRQMEFLNDSRNRYKEKRDEFYSNLNRRLNFLLGIEGAHNHFWASTEKADFSSFVKEISKKTQNLFDYASAIIQKNKIEESDYDNFRVRYQHLQAFSKKVSEKFYTKGLINIKEKVNVLESAIEEKINIFHEAAKKHIDRAHGWKLEVPARMPEKLKTKRFYLDWGKNVISFEDNGGRKTYSIEEQKNILRLFREELKKQFLVLKIPDGMSVKILDKNSERSLLQYIFSSRTKQKHPKGVLTKQNSNTLEVYIPEDVDVPVVFCQSKAKNQSNLNQGKPSHFSVCDRSRARLLDLDASKCKNITLSSSSDGKKGKLFDDTDVYEEICEVFYTHGVMFNPAKAKCEQPTFQRKILPLLKDDFILPAASKEIADFLMALKKLANGIPNFKARANKAIDTLMVMAKKEIGSQIIGRLRIHLNKELSGTGRMLIADHKSFAGSEVKDFNERTNAHGIDYVLDNLEGNTAGRLPDVVDRNIKQSLERRYKDFEREYTGLYKKCLGRPEYRAELIDDIKHKARKVSVKKDGICWDTLAKDRVISLMAHIFALWTVENKKYYQDANYEGSLKARELYLLKPRAAQVVSIFRMLGLDERGAVLKNHLIEIGTGEGKSIVLAVAAAVLALLGIEVSCVCYSEYLSTRDHAAFEPLFDALDITESIHYGTFDQACEREINAQGDIRSRVQAFIENPTRLQNNIGTHHMQRPRVLLIDEVDVFFNKDFYGNLYTPIVNLRKASVTALADLIWQKKGGLYFNHLRKSAAYKNCCGAFEGWEFLVETAAKQMLADSKDFLSHDYIVAKDKIAYKSQDVLSFKIAYGYKTLFAYYHECENGKISKESLANYISMQVNCGSFSYAEIPHRFQAIMGVTGTLKTLSNAEKGIIQQNYQIKQNTYIPSIFGKNKRQFRKEADTKIENGDDYVHVIVDEIENRLCGSSDKRAVMVFFETKKRLMDFYHSDAFSSHKNDRTLILTEEVTASEKEDIIRMATSSGRISLFTRLFGRGTDFVCYDQRVLRNAGVHVIQTFLSEEVSEEIQIKGRCARQGDSGSYSMVLCDKDLERFSVREEDVEQARNSGVVYDMLDAKRNEYFRIKYNGISHYITTASKEHARGQQFLRDMQDNNRQGVQDFLQGHNKSNVVGVSQSRTLCLMDATGSMSHLLDKAKHTVGTMFERAYATLHAKNIQDSFALQFAVYRNYNCEKDKILQYSPWEMQPERLRQFMDNINVAGGLRNEAIEIGLWHVNQESENGHVSQVILIGDMPPNTEKEVIKKRKKHYGEKYWQASKFGGATFYKNELRSLIDNGVPVHGFYVKEKARDAFTEIADATGGKSQALDVSSDRGAEDLTNLVTKQVLDDIDTDGDYGLVEEYDKRFIKTYSA